MAGGTELVQAEQLLARLRAGHNILGLCFTASGVLSAVLGPPDYKQAAIIAR